MKFDELLQLSDAINTKQKWTKGYILPFSKKGDLGITANYKGIILTAIAAKIYNAQLFNRIRQEVKNVLVKNQNGFRRNRSWTSPILTVRQIIEEIRAKNSENTL